MHNVADYNLWSEEIEDGSDEECQILGVYEPFATSLLRPSVISGRKRPAVDSQSIPMEATGFEQRPLIVAGEEVVWPFPMTSESVVQSSSLTPEQITMLEPTIQLLPQTFQPCTSSPLIRTPYVHTSSSSTNHLIASSCPIPVNSSSPPQTNHPQETFEQPWPSSQANNIPPITLPSLENNSETSDKIPIHQAQAVMDLSSPQQGQLSRSNATVMIRQPIWQGTFNFKEKAANISDPNVSYDLACTILASPNAANKLSMETNLWPVQMPLNLVARKILKEKNMFEVLKNASHYVVIHFREKSPVLKRIKRKLKHGWVGCVVFTIPRDVRIMIVFYMPDKRAFLGTLPRKQKVFLNTFKHVYENQQMQNLQKEIPLYICNTQPSSSSTSITVNLNEQTRNQFEDVDNEINTRISALYRQHQESQPSTSSHQPGPSHQDSNESMEAILRVEATQKRNTKLKIPWRKSPRVEPYYGLQQSSGTASVGGAAASTSNIAATTVPIIGEYATGESTTTDFDFTEIGRSVEIYTTPQTQEVPTASPIAQSSQKTFPSADENPVELQASEIFDKELIQDVVNKTFAQTGKRFHSLEELCDAILKFEESKLKTVEKNSKKDICTELLCKICLDEKLSIAFEPCGHLATCQECSQSLTKCPICRSIVKGKMRIYM